MKDQDDIEIRSEEVQEILGTPPNWMARYGTLLALLAVVAMGYIAYFIEYPEVIEAGITITTTDPPKRLIAQNAGRIKEIRVDNEARVAQGEVLIIFESNARVGDVLTLETRLLALGTPSDSALLAFSLPDSLVLGSLKEPLFDFYRSQENLSSYIDNPYDKYSMSQLRRKREQVKVGIRSDRARWSNLDREIDMVRSRLRRQQDLAAEQLLPQNQVEATRQELLSLERMRESAESSIKRGEREIERLRAEMSGVRAGSEEMRQQASIALRESFGQLQQAVEAWVAEHLIVSPIDGIVSFYSESINEQQYVEEGAGIGVVVPIRERDTEGTVWLPVSKTSPVEKGQKAVIRFDGYPALEYGAVIGEVKNKSQVPINGQISITIGFPGGLVTRYGRTVDAAQEMKGEVTIVLEDKRFLEYLIEPFRSN